MFPKTRMDLVTARLQRRRKTQTRAELYKQIFISEFNIIRFHLKRSQKILQIHQDLTIEKNKLFQPSRKSFINSLN